jgi:hypothetical protein
MDAGFLIANPKNDRTEHGILLIDHGAAQLGRALLGEGRSGDEQHGDGQSRAEYRKLSRDISRPRSVWLEKQQHFGPTASIMEHYSNVPAARRPVSNIPEQVRYSVAFREGKREGWFGRGTGGSVPS